jgi:hypothetical protein
MGRDGICIDDVRNGRPRFDFEAVGRTVGGTDRGLAGRSCGPGVASTGVHSLLVDSPLGPPVATWADVAT